MIKQKTIDKYVGLTHNRWTVNSYSHTLSGRRNYFNCTCVCGTQRTVDILTILNNSSTSCGCYHRELTSKMFTGHLYNKLPEGKASFNGVYNQYKKNARYRNHIFNLSKYDFLRLILDNCFYCNYPPSNKLTTKYEIFLYSGIDRIDNSKDYTIDNCVPCCKFCNLAKGTSSVNDFVSWIENIHSTKLNERILSKLTRTHGNKTIV